MDENITIKNENAITGSELFRQVNDILRKYAAPGKLESISASATGVEAMINNETGDVMYRFVTWDNVEVSCLVNVADMMEVGPRKYLDKWEGKILEYIDNYRRTVAKRATYIIQENSKNAAKH